MKNHVIINGKPESLTGSCTTMLGRLDVLFYATTLGANREDSIEISGEDLDTLINLQDSVKLWSRSSIGAIGQLMATVNEKELPSGCVTDLGFLISGISELMFCLEDAGVILERIKEKQTATASDKAQTAGNKKPT